jgi:hypothetical protein
MEWMVVGARGEKRIVKGVVRERERSSHARPTERNASATCVWRPSPVSPPAEARALGPGNEGARKEKSLLDWNRADWPAMRCKLAACDWRELLRGKTAEQGWTCSKNMCSGLLTSTPERRRRNHNKPPWLSREILRAIRRKKRLWRAAKNGQHMEEYKAAEKQTKNMIRNAKRNFQRGIVKGCCSDQVNKKHFFAYIRRRTKCRPGVGPLKDAHCNISRKTEKLRSCTTASSVFSLGRTRQTFRFRNQLAVGSKSSK